MRLADLHDELAAPGPSSTRSTWCVCGHHACFHLRGSRAPQRRAPSIDIPRRPLHAACGSQCERQCQLLPGAQCDAHPSVDRADEKRPPEHQAIPTERIHSQTSLSTRFLKQTSQVFGSGGIAQSQGNPSQASTSGLPGIPSVCLLSREHRPATNNDARHGADQSRQSLAGLGLSMMNLESIGQINCQQQSPTSTVPDDFNVAQAPQRPCSAPGPYSTRANSIQNEANVSSPSRGILEHVYEYNRQIQLDIPGDTIPNTYNPDEYVQSATEVATPSAANTPDLNAADCAVQQGKNLIDQLTHLTSNMPQQSNNPPDRSTCATVPTQLLLPNPSAAPQEQLQHLLQSAPPQGLQKLVSYLAPLHNLLNSIPNVAKTMQDLGSRLDMLENGSFNYVQPEDLNQTLEMYEGRLIDVEQRTGEHDKLLQARDDRGSHSPFGRFGSNHSGESTTSSALILAAVDRQETEMEIENIKERLEVLEAAAPPTSLSPWEVEVVLLPWGPDLRGIWFSPDESMHDTAKSITQSSEEWTETRTSKGLPFSDALGRDTDSSPRSRAQTSAKGPSPNPTEGGWSSQDISNWASGSTDDWLFPKACGSNNLVYKRLQSRGFVRDVTFRGASAKDIQEALSRAFCDVFDYLQYDDSDENPMIAEYPGLRAPYIPLRKVLKETRLRFLTPAEMSSSALWSAQFLAAGVMMRVTGGKKRLYVTVREAYTQQIDRNEFVIMEQSWPELRQLPRYQPSQDSKMDGNDEHDQAHIPEADAKEACWQFVEAYDAPPASIHSSFGSIQSLQLTMRPADRQWRRSITPNSILKKKQLRPISPVSENNPRRPSYRDRTVSTSVVETFPPGSSKRRFNSSPVKQSSAPQHVSRTPSLSMTKTPQLKHKFQYGMLRLAARENRLRHSSPRCLHSNDQLQTLPLPAGQASAPSP
ncbi:hypothetical protein GMOD_00009429 [Pyrenophora seminiperda CCB06]|uniref:Uncharacterized protein n=1 Tax=Pyrenophora seminiperda CCB06 TaxID=1302712 RepID=A0A3M7MGM2_9PLEO|nr:hypothetical protein GMOD_00009429 [Pyrenophora seminiperda CCB06]